MLLLTLLAAPVLADDAFDPGPSPYLMRHPTLSKDKIVFQFAGDLWWVPRAGGEAQRLTNAPGVESTPHFSPDGATVAFSGTYDGNRDIFVVPSAGGVPKRLTAHPAADTVMGWTPDGKSVMFTSSMLSETDYARMFTVPVTGGTPKMLPFPAGVQAAMSPDMKQVAYVPNGKWQQAWKRYRGGQTTPIWIAQMSDSKWKAIPRSNTNDERPMWVGDSIYYLSDPEGPVGLYRYDTKTGRSNVEVRGNGFDIKMATAGPGAIVYEQFGSLNLYDLATKKSTRVPVTISGDFPEVRPQFKDVSSRLTGLSISPSGQRIVASARGWIFTIPAQKGDWRVIGSETQGVNRRDPAWSPDTKTIAYISDEKGVQELVLHDTLTSSEKTYPLPNSPGYFNRPRWSPDSTMIAITDEKLNLWVIHAANGKAIKVDTLTYRGPTTFDPAWSPDSKWLTYVKDLDTHYNAVFLYSFETGKAIQITDGLAHADNAIFDRDGKHLYFTASTDIGQGIDFEDISSSIVLNSTSSVYCVVLRKDLPNPLHPESDEEAPKDVPKAQPKEEKFRIDLENIEDRIITLPVPRAIYTTLAAGPAGSFFLQTSPARATASDFGGPGTLQKFTWSDRKLNPFAAGVGTFQVSADGTKMLLRAGPSTSVVSTTAPPQPGQGAVSLTGLRVKIDPTAEWKHMYDEAWRNQQMLFYDPGLHGIDVPKLMARYRPFLDNIRSRDDLNYLFTDMFGELVVGHMFIGGGDIPGSGAPVPGGLLGADFSFENGRYKITRIYNGERWNPGLYAPLAQPGINAKVGEYILAIDGKDLTDAIDIYEALEYKAGRQVKVKLGPTPDGTGSREATVVPVADEFNLRFRAWTENNRRLVEKMTNGRGAYVHVPDTGGGGWQAFQRYFYAQSGKDGLIVDDRFNHGGAINDFMVREMKKPLDFFSATRYGKEILIPPTGIYGPKVMLINEMAGSGGDIFPYLFKQEKTGKLIGKRTWGAMISNYGFNLLDGGRISSPDDAMFNVSTGQWIIENWGTPPDIEVELDPHLWRQGRDAQLEKAIEVLNKDLANFKSIKPKRPAYPDWTKLKKDHWK